MNSEADADKMDYLLRDSINCGVTYGQYDLERLLHSFVVYDDGQQLRLGVNYGGVHALRLLFWLAIGCFFRSTSIEPDES